MNFPIIQKPPYHEPCNRCGECCRSGPCDLAINFLGCEEGRQCTALEIEPDGRYSCGLYKRPEHHLRFTRRFTPAELEEFRGLVSTYLGIGTWCQMKDDGTPTLYVVQCDVSGWA